MKKQIVLLTAVAGFALFGTAFASNSNDAYFNGPYIGVKAGTRWVKVNITRFDRPLARWPNKWDKPQAKATYGVDIGYGHVFNHFYLGGEIGYYQSQKLNDITYLNSWDTNRFHNKLSGELTADALIGYTITPRFLFFGHVGLGYQSITSNYWVNRTFHPPYPPGYLMHDVTKDFMSLRYGGGFKYAVTKHIDVSVDYTREITGTIHFPPMYESGHLGLTEKPESNTVMFGLQYTF